MSTSGFPHDEEADADEQSQSQHSSDGPAANQSAEDANKKKSQPTSTDETLDLSKTAPLKSSKPISSIETQPLQNPTASKSSSHRFNVSVPNGTSSNSHTKASLNFKTSPVDKLDRIGKFEIKEKVGEGGMGVVYRAYDADLMREVAIKKVHPRFGGDQDYARRFLSEARSVAAVIHPNVAQIYSIHDKDEELPYFVMEFIKGQSVEQLIRSNGKLSPARAIQFVTDAAKGLRAARQRGLIHRDIKPSNVIVSDREEVKLVDFGLARKADELNSITEAGVILGTPQYVSPEQARGHSVDHRSDIYSLGCTFYYMLLGKELFAGRSKVEVLLAHQSEEAPALEDSDNSLDPRLDKVIQRMLVKDPVERYQSYDELLEDLYELSDPKRKREAEPSNRGVFAGLLLGLLTVLLFGWGVNEVWQTDSGIESSFRPKQFYPGVYTQRENEEWLEYNFAENPKLEDYFYPNAPADGYSMVPKVRDKKLRWQNFTGALSFPFLEELKQFVLLGVSFEGEPHFQWIIGLDPDRLEWQLRITFAVGSENQRHRFVELSYQGEQVPVSIDPKALDFKFDNQNEYDFQLITKPSQAERPDQISFELVVSERAIDSKKRSKGSNNSSSSTSSKAASVEIARVPFSFQKKYMPSGSVGLFGDGNQSWQISVRDVLVQGKLDIRKEVEERIGPLALD